MVSRDSCEWSWVVHHCTLHSESVADAPLAPIGYSVVARLVILEIDKWFMKTSPLNSSFVCFWNMTEERNPFAYPHWQLIRLGEPHD